MKETVQVTDPALPGLAAALDPAVMTPRLAPLLQALHSEAAGRPGDWRVVGVDVLKHKPGRRCALAYTLAGPGGERRLFAKAFAGERGEAILETLGRIASAVPRDRLLVPRPAGYLADLRILVLEYLEVVPLARSLYEGSPDDAARRMAAAASALHACQASLARRWSPAQEIENTARWLEGLAVRHARLMPRARRLLEDLTRAAARLPAPGRPVHRDFYPDQVWDCGGRTALLDLDDARSGDPALDLGNFLAHLTLRSLQFPGVARGCERARGLFARAYDDLRAPGMDDASLWERAGFYEAASLLRLAGVYSGRERWAETVPARLLDACEGCTTNQSSLEQLEPGQLQFAPHEERRKEGKSE